MEELEAGAKEDDSVLDKYITTSSRDWAEYTAMSKLKRDKTNRLEEAKKKQFQPMGWRRAIAS